MDRSVGSPRTRSVVGVRGPGVSVFGLPFKLLFSRCEVLSRYVADKRSHVNIYRMSFGLSSAIKSSNNLIWLNYRMQGHLFTSH